jgi:hypothetical protein
MLCISVYTIIILKISYFFIIYHSVCYNLLAGVSIIIWCLMYLFYYIRYCIYYIYSIYSIYSIIKNIYIIKSIKMLAENYFAFSKSLTISLAIATNKPFQKV